jgi:protein involved in polysaccharide export with SLBB domain
MSISRALHVISCFVRAEFVVLLVALLMSSSTRADPSSDYQIAPGDTIKLDILDDDEIPVDLPVGPDGAIQAPFIGGVRVAGLTLADAVMELKRSYVENRIFVVPKVGISVAAYRPVFVIGDVRLPGSYPFEPQLTAEKALGLAGGQLQATLTENPVLASARLRQELELAEADIIREALAVARATAQLEGRTTILDEDVPEEARSYLEADAEPGREVQLRILTAAADSYTSQTALLTEQLAEAERGLALLQELSQNATGNIDLARADLKRAQDLQKRGIKTLTDVSNLMRQTSMEEARQLQILSDLSDARRGIGELKSKLADLAKTRTMEALLELEKHSADLTKFLTSRRGAEEQLILVSSLTAEELVKNKQVVLDFMIRRETDGSTAELKAAPDTLLLPGDVLVVRMGDRDGTNVTSLPTDTASSPAQ